MRRAGFICGALLLASCAFGSERALFGASDAVYPIADGAVYRWRAYPESEDLVVRFTRRGAGYEAMPLSRDDDRPMQIVFAPIPETQEDDYIAQVDVRGEGEGLLYAFLWPLGGDRYRVIADPRGFDENGDTAAPNLCAHASYGSCTFASAENARAFFRQVLYPAFRRGQTPREFIDIAPEGADLPPAPVPTPSKKSTKI